MKGFSGNVFFVMAKKNGQFYFGKNEKRNWSCLYMCICKEERKKKREKRRIKDKYVKILNIKY